MTRALALHDRLQRIWRSPRGWRGAAAVNHNVVGRRFVLTALAFFFVGGILAMLMRAQLATAGAVFLEDAVYHQVFTMHGTVMMFLFAIPLIEGFAIYLLPKMLGARDLAYPRLGVLGYWCYLFGGLILLTALALGLAPDASWFMYTPLSDRTHSPGVNADVWLLGVSFVEISAITAAVEIVATILHQRAPGMHLSRMPLFAWAMLVTALMMLVGFPPLILGSVLLEVERAFGWPFFDPARGGDPLLWQHLFWLFGHPEVYIIFLPAAGIVSTLVPVFSGRPIVGYRFIVAGMAGLGVISFGLLVHHMFTVGIPALAQWFFSAASMLAAIPTAMQFFAWIATLWMGRPRRTLPMLYLFGFLTVFVCGGLTGVMLALVPFNWQVHDTHFVVAHLHYVLIGGFLFPMLAGLYYWYPHMFGRCTLPRLGTWAFWLVFVGFNTAFLVMHLTGLLGMPRRVATYEAGLGWDLPNLVSSIGSFVMAIGLFLLLLDLLLSAWIGPLAPRNPWRAGTLEWATATPPPAYTFGSQPQVTGRDPLWDDTRGAALPARLAAGDGWLADSGPGEGEQRTLGTDPLDAAPTHYVRLPRPSLIPLWAGLAMAAVFLSMLTKFYWGVLPAGLAALAVFWRWAWSIGLRADPADAPCGPDQGAPALPPHDVARHAPGVAGVRWTLVADGAFWVSLLFGYAYLWVVAPGWPPAAWVEGGLPAAAAAALALLLTAVAARQACARAGDGAARQRWLAVAAGAGVAAVGLLAAGGLAALPSPRSHAYGATVAACIVYAGFHAAVGVLFAAYGWTRGRAGFVSARRTVELRVLRMWTGYSAVTGIVLLAAVYLPGVFR